jgi:hypothetical protein
MDDKDAEEATLDFDRALGSMIVVAAMERVHAAEGIVVLAAGAFLLDQFPDRFDGYGIRGISPADVDDVVATLVPDSMREAFSAPHDADRMRVLYVNGRGAFARVLRLNQPRTS